MMSQRKLYLVKTCSTVRKRAKKTWDTTVETTDIEVERIKRTKKVLRDTNINK